MREDGFIADKLLLTRDASYTPNARVPTGAARRLGTGCAARYAERCAGACDARPGRNLRGDGRYGLRRRVRGASGSHLQHSPCDEDGVALDARCTLCREDLPGEPVLRVTGWSGACRVGSPPTVG
jgi:hypothetical protein